MDIQFIASVALVTPDAPDARKLFVDTLGLPLEPHPGDDYWFSEAIPGSRHFGVWPLSQAADACFGSNDWPSDRPVPHACFEFEVADLASVQTAADELVAKGYTPLHPVRTEPWGQTITRIQTPEGAIIGICFSPWMHG